MKNPAHLRQTLLNQFAALKLSANVGRATESWAGLQKLIMNPTPFNPLLSIARMLAKRKIKNALEELRTAQKYEQIFTKTQYGELEHAYVLLIGLEIQMRKSAAPSHAEKNL